MWRQVDRIIGQNAIGHGLTNGRDVAADIDAHTVAGHDVDADRRAMSAAGRDIAANGDLGPVDRYLGISVAHLHARGVSISRLGGHVAAHINADLAAAGVDARRHRVAEDDDISADANLVGV